MIEYPQNGVQALRAAEQDVVCPVVLWRFRYQWSLRDVAEMFLQQGLILASRKVPTTIAVTPVFIRRGAGHACMGD
jgi:hypothetical protein